MPKAIIVGAGIGGLTTALACHHFGWEAEILEQASDLKEIGAGIQISPNAMKVFNALGMTQRLEYAGFKPEAIDLRMGVSGLRLIRAPLGDVAEKRWGAPYLHIHRADLVMVLEETLKERVPGAIRLNTRVQAYEQTADGISAHLADGGNISGDVLIGADGIHSIVRTQMLGPDKAEFTGNLAWRAVVPVERLGSHVPLPVAGAWMGRGKHAVTYLLRQGQLANFVGVVERGDWTKESWTEEGTPEEALNDFPGWHSTITELIKEADTLYRWALFDRTPLKTWSDGRAALLGDAAHPMLPFMAQGSAMAVEDAWAIAASLAESGGVPDALKAYQNLRYVRASIVQAGSRANAKTFHQRSVLGRLKTYGPMWLAGHLAPSMGLARQDAVYAYDITKKTGVQEALGDN